MRAFFFSFIAVVFGTIIAVNARIGNTLIEILGTISGATSIALARLSGWILRLIDKERYEHQTSVIEQSGELSELELLKAAVQVRDDALRGRVWTMQHTAALNRIGNTLHFHFGWEIPRIHTYLREVVEAIPNMTYGNME